MTRQEFENNVNTMGINIFFKMLGEVYFITYIPVHFVELDKWGYREIGINSELAIDEYHEKHKNDDDYYYRDVYVWYKTLDELLDGYKIDGVPLGELLDKIEDMWGVVYA